MRLFDLTDRVAVVTGGNSGIGLGMVRGLSEAGANIAIIARNESRSQQVVEEIQSSGRQAMSVACDVTDASAVKDAVNAINQHFGGVNILVNNAGTSVRKRPEELTYKEWRHVLDTNMDSAFHVSQAVYPLMRDGGGGKILNNGSMLSLFGSPWGAAYAASKGAMVQFTKSLATAWAEDNIQVNCFLPGWIDTPLTVGAREQVPGLEDKVTARTPAGRWGEPADFAGIAVFLASPASDFVTGTAIAVDGGFSVSVV